MKAHYHRTAQQIMDDLLWYKAFTKDLTAKLGHPMPSLLYILPANFTTSEYYDGSKQLRQEVIRLMKQTSQICVELPQLSMTEDGVHYSLDAHQKVAEIIYNQLVKGEI